MNKTINTVFVLFRRMVICVCVRKREMDKDKLSKLDERRKSKQGEK